MGLFDVLGTVVDALDGAGIPHMVSGSVASARHGEARATQDIDIVIAPNRGQLVHFLELLGGTGLYVGDGLAALAARSSFNVIDSTSGWKVDLIIRRDRTYSTVEFDRRQPTNIGGVDVYIVTAEDSILSKLEWGRPSGSERQLRDVRSLLAVQGSALDRSYLYRWAKVLGVKDLLLAAEEEVGRGPSDGAVSD